MKPPNTDAPQTGYSRYACMDELLSLQHPQTGEPAEAAFIVLSQVKELLFDLLATDVEHAARQLAADDIAAACHTLDRVIATIHTLQASWEPLTVMRPDEFVRIRTALTGASGLQSVSYRRWEFAMGRRDAAMLTVFHDYPEPLRVLTEALHQPSLYDEALGLLARHHHCIPDAVQTRDVSTAYEPHPDIVETWADIYRAGSAGDPLLHLAEQLTKVAYAVSQWRYEHLLTVEKMIGRKPGTGGTSGADWLTTIADHRFFPELWEARQAL